MEPLRIVIFPWPAFGHLLPYLELAEQLASRGHSVSYLSTSRNLARLPPLHPATAPRIDLVALPSVEEGAAESSYDLPDEKHELFFKIFDGLAAPFSEFLDAACADEATRPHWVVGCEFHHLVAAAAVEHKVPFAVLLTTAAMIVSVPRPPPVHPLEAAAVVEKAAAAAQAVPRYERRAMAAVGASIAQRCFLTQERSTLGAMRSCVEWEPESFPLVATLLGMPVAPLGLLPPSPDGGRADREHAAVRWLDAQPPGSVLYVAMGSEVRLREEQVRELALGLEDAGVRYLWALRKPSGAGDTAKDVLPPGFQERTRGHGLVDMGWVPQMSILAHAGVGGFLTHCGRNSLIEGLLFGRPLVMLPISADQGPNARQMEAKKVGLQVPREEEDGSFDRHGIASTVRAVMVDGEARRGFLCGAAKMKEVVADKKLQDRYIDQFIQQLISYAAAGPKHQLKSKNNE